MGVDRIGEGGRGAEEMRVRGEFGGQGGHGGRVQGGAGKQ